MMNRDDSILDWILNVALATKRIPELVVFNTMVIGFVAYSIWYFKDQTAMSLFMSFVLLAAIAETAYVWVKYFALVRRIKKEMKEKSK